MIIKRWGAKFVKVATKDYIVKYAKNNGLLINEVLDYMVELLKKHGKGKK